MKPVIKRAEEMPPPLMVVGEGITVVSDKSETSDYEIFLHEGPEGSGPPPHHHGWDETFYVLDGQIEIGSGAEKVTAGPGTLVHAPAGTPHWFRFGKGGGKMMGITGQKSNASTLYAELARQIPSGAVDLEKLGAVAGRNGVSIGGY